MPQSNSSKIGKIAVLLSGRGSNFEAIYSYTQDKNSNFSIALVISDNEDAPGLKNALNYGLEATAVLRSSFKSKKSFEQHIVNLLDSHKIDLVCLAGYMRIIGATMLNAYEGRILNIHPSLLPAFPGLNAQQQAFEKGVKISGCTVHFVDSGVDTGEIIAQSAVPVLPDDSAETLSQRILSEEHKLYSVVISNYFKQKF